MIRMTVQESRRKYRREPDRQDVIDCCKLGSLKWVQTLVQSTHVDEGGFWEIANNPEWIHLYLVDQEGKTAELILHSFDRDLKNECQAIKEKVKKMDAEALNRVFNHFNLLPKGKIIGINWGIIEAIEHAKRQYPGWSTYDDTGKAAF